jgi:sugar phosphate isomerase/epimerase
MIFIAVTLAARAGENRDLYAFDNGLTRTATTTGKAALLKELGYAGIASRSGEVAKLIPALNDAGLRMIASYTPIKVNADSAKVAPGLAEEIQLLKTHHSFIWIYVTGERGKPKDDLVVAELRRVADMAADAGLQVSIYPHFGFYIATVNEALEIIKKVDRPNVGVCFNLSHFLIQNNIEDLEETIRTAAPHLNLVSINGADNGSKLPMNRAIQRLDRGSFNVSAFLELLDDVGYKGPVTLQCYNLKGDDRENLKASMAIWQKMTNQNGNTGSKER